MIAIYNEIEPYAAQWTRNLIAAGHIAPGVVDERSISDLVPADVDGPGQRHFFAGIAGWSLALRLAGVADDAKLAGRSIASGLADAKEERRRSRRIDEAHGRSSLEPQRYRDDRSVADASRDGWREGIDLSEAAAQRGAGPSHRGWESCEWIPCSDGVARPVEPGAHPLAHGVPARVGKLRAYGNAFVPEAGAAFVRAAIEALREQIHPAIAGADAGDPMRGDA